MDKNKPIPNERFLREVKTSDSFTKPAFEDNSKKREYQRSVKEDKLKDFSIGIKDIDETIHYYFTQVIKPTVVQNGKRLNVPILYGSPERWKSVQKDGFYRDKNGKVQTPLIMFKRESIEKNRTLSNKIDANNPHNFMVVEKKYSKKNIYDRFSVITNRVPVKEFETIVVPDFVDITYSCIIFTDYVEQMNKLIEAVNYASDSYWGDPVRFQFRASIDTFTTSIELNQGQDRAVKTNFTIKLSGRIIPDTINAKLQGSKKVYSTGTVKFGFEAVTSDLNEKPKPVKQTAGVAVSDQIITNIINQPMTQEQINYISTNTVLSSNTTTVDVSSTTNLMYWKNVKILTPPLGFPTLTKNDFQVYINGLVVETDAISSIYQRGNDVAVQFNSTLGFTISSTDEFNISGKLAK